MTQQQPQQQPPADFDATKVSRPSKPRDIPGWSHVSSYCYVCGTHHCGFRCKEVSEATP
jgi:hypothetical protein